MASASETLHKWALSVKGGERAVPFAEAAAVRVLVANDSPVERRLLYRILTSHNFHVMLAEDGAEAWKILNDPALAPKIAILDLLMPGIDGLKLCAMLRERKDPSTYVIMLTSEGDRAQVLQAFDRGVDDFITKPFDPLNIRARVDVGRRIVQTQQKLADAMEALRFQATHDGLTSVLNHASVISELERELGRSARISSTTGVLLMDLDDFKQVNEQHGHSAGDEVLAEVPRRAKKVLRRYDSVGRYGGEEFLMILPQLPVSDAVEVAERIRHGVASLPIRFKDQPLMVTVSIGVALGKGDCGAAGVIDQADEALYRAKSLGRNRVELFTHGARARAAAASG